MKKAIRDKAKKVFKRFPKLDRVWYDNKDVYLSNRTGAKPLHRNEINKVKTESEKT